VSRLDDLRELREYLRGVVLAEHSEHGLQGVSGLVGQYQRCIDKIAELEALQPAAKGTVLDELKQRRTAAKAPASRPDSSKIRTERRR
jgi:hypothetical protein